MLSSTNNTRRRRPQQQRLTSLTTTHDSSLSYRRLLVQIQVRHVWYLVGTLISGLLVSEGYVYYSQVQHWKSQLKLWKRPLEFNYIMASMDEQLRDMLRRSSPKPHFHTFQDLVSQSSPATTTSTTSADMPKNRQWDSVLQEVYYHLYNQETAASTSTDQQKLATENDNDNDDFWFQPIFAKRKKTKKPSSAQQQQQQQQHRRSFDIQEWLQTEKATTGGLLDKDRILLGQIYSHAHSVMEYGLGESTLMADYLGVTRYVGIDSDPEYVAKTRATLLKQHDNEDEEEGSNANDDVHDHFRFYFADIGETRAWGYPSKPWLPKNILHYELLPLIMEPIPFQVYLVDGRWRLACMLLCFLHASAMTNNNNLQQVFHQSSSSSSSQQQTQQQQQFLQLTFQIDETSQDHHHHQLHHDDHPMGDNNLNATITTSPDSPIVLIHDCHRYMAETEWARRVYKEADHLLQLIHHSGAKLCVYQRRNTTTDEQLFQLWLRFAHVVG
ncbi:expressed unknown protein [Seminavis robusta]|uniref:Methyltransferase domain-containing protein n=1 Tax=Seminavis robusta TaxID=568900 RepID=A0A9N8HNG2_9STRA|nr:expressed unknown protein [Seminavis robusta]|eukprot:Sro1082_g239180.1 n/a (498) ;mRNA; f:12011-13504